MVRVGSRVEGLPFRCEVNLYLNFLLGGFSVGIFRVVAGDCAFSVSVVLVFSVSCLCELEVDRGVEGLSRDGQVVLFVDGETFLISALMVESVRILSVVIVSFSPIVVGVFLNLISGPKPGLYMVIWSSVLCSFLIFLTIVANGAFGYTLYSLGV